MKEMAKYQSGMGFYSQMPDTYTLVVNSDNEIVKAILADTKANKSVSSMKQIIDLALLQNGMLKGEALDKFLKRSVDLLK